MLDYKKYGIKKTLLGYLIVIFFGLVVSLLSIFLFTFSLVHYFSGLIPIFVFSSIPLAYFLVAIFIFKVSKKRYSSVDKGLQFRLDLCKTIVVYIVVLLSIFLIFLIYLAFPFAEIGTNNIPLSISIQPYSLKDTISSYSENDFSLAKEIYSEYNITLQIESIIYLNQTAGDVDKIFSQNCTSVESIYNLTDKESSKTVKLVLIDYKSHRGGMAHICGIDNLMIINLNGSSSAGWVLAHELGHIFGAKSECWRFNLMKEYSGYCPKSNWITHNFIKELYPNFLDQQQVDIIVNSIKARQER
jgi:hypothetical protein